MRGLYFLTLITVALSGNATGSDLDLSRDVAPLDIDSISSHPPKTLDATAGFELSERVAPQTTLAITLEDARSAVLQNQLEVRLQRLPPQIARETLVVEQSRFDAVFTGQYSERKSTSFSKAESRGQTTALSTTIPLRTGGSVTVSIPLSTSKDGTQDIHAASATLDFSQPLLRNGGFLVNTAGIRTAELSTQIADANAKLVVINYLANVDRAYWRHWAAGRNLDVRYEQYQFADKQRYNAKEMAAAGLVAKVEIIRADSGRARRVEDIIIAENTRRFTERELKRIMNRTDLPLGGNQTLISATEPSLVQYFIDPDKVYSQALTNRMDLLEAQLQVAIDSLSSEVARHQLLPLFSFDFSYTLKNFDTDRTAVLENLADNEYPDWVAGVTVEWPLGNRAAKARLQRSVLQKTFSLETLDLRRRQIETDVRNTVDQLNQSWQRILAAQTETRIAQTIYNAELEQFKLGMNTSTNVLDAAQYIANAKTREINAIADYEIAKVELAYAAGVTLGHARVALDR